MLHSQIQIVEVEAVVSRGGGGKVWRQRMRIGITLFQRPPQYILHLYL
jgi:hypothetical protein